MYCAHAGVASAGAQNVPARPPSWILEAVEWNWARQTCEPSPKPGPEQDEAVQVNIGPARMGDNIDSLHKADAEALDDALLTSRRPSPMPTL